MPAPSNSRIRFSSMASSWVSVRSLLACLETMEVRDMQIMMRIPMKKINRPFIVPVMPSRLMNARKAWGNKSMIPMMMPLKIQSSV